jgi:hypothetical protein
VVYEIPSKEFGKDVEPQMIQHEFIAEKGQEYAIRAVCSKNGHERDLAFAAQVGESFGMYWTQWPVLPPPPPPVAASVWIGVGPALYQYSGDANDATPGYGTMIYARYPLGSDGFSIMAFLEQGFVEGGTTDENGNAWEFLSPFYAGGVLLNRRIVTFGPADVTAEGGVGLMYIKSVNEETQGAHPFFPLGIAVKVRLLSGFGVVFGTHVNFSMGDLDGLQSNQTSDRFFDMSIGFSIF